MSRDSFGFQFWLLWIVSFAASFLVSAVFWTWLITRFLGSLAEPELLVTWAIAVFGCWFLILTPFMRKKERIWKRLNHDEEKAVSAWLWAMGSFVASVILVCLFWDWKLRDRIAASDGIDRVWMKNVFASCLALTLPLLVFLYKKADQIYKAALARQTQLGPKFQTGYLEQSKRILSPELMEKIKTIPETLSGGHVLNLELKDGRIIPNVFIFRGREILGVYDVPAVTFQSVDVRDVFPPEILPAFEEERWLRLDGRA